ncbi:unnamed protein product [Penicillium salamii]|nr:unnamed protein product [Penicillium salamii]
MLKIITSRRKPPFISSSFFYTNVKIEASHLYSCLYILQITISRYIGQYLDPISKEINPIDHQVLYLGGILSNLDRLQSRLQHSKQQFPDLRIKLEETVYEINYLRAELQWHKETKQILQERIFDIFTSLEDTLTRVTARLYESEQQYLRLWGSNSRSEVGGYV